VPTSITCGACPRRDRPAVRRPSRDLAEVVEQVARLGARLLLQTVLEAEVAAFLGRERYQRDPDANPGHRNGHPPMTIKTTSGPLTLERPKLRGTDQRFASALLGAQVTRSNALEALVIAGFVRGLSTRDLEATLAEALGAQAALSRSTVSRICQQISTEFAPGPRAAWPRSSWAICTWTGTCFRYHPGARAEPVLVAHGITTCGSPVSWAWPRRPVKAMTCGSTSSATSAPEGYSRRCW
jgi:putative transposase